MVRLWKARVWPLRLAVRYLAVAVLAVFTLANYLRWHDSHAGDGPGGFTSLAAQHPVKQLMAEAKARFDDVLARRSRDLDAACARYRARRGRHPPPGFDVWFRAALEADAVVVEDFFDRIYKDLTPFWALDPRTTKRRASAWHWVVRVRNGNASGHGDVEGRVPWLQLWTGLVSEFARHLPDVDMPVNMLDEPRLLVPFAQMARLVWRANDETAMVAPRHATAEFQGLRQVDDEKPEPYDPDWLGPSNSYWNLAVKTCGPESPARGVEQMRDLAKPAEFPRNWRPGYAHRGFVRNWTAARDPCLQPHLRQLHGSFIEPLSLSSSSELIPLFGGSKLPMNNEILIPGAMYLTDDEFYSGGDSHGPEWPLKRDSLVWRGDSSGGRAKEHNWHHFQRHRLVDMLNGTTVARVEATGARAPTFELPSRAVYGRLGKLSAWLADLADAAFVSCLPDLCDALAPFFRLSPAMPMKTQYESKFLPDVDGNSFSARFRGFLRSTSLPLKATIYAEWHDDRLAPWVHFVPLDNTLQDLYPALAFLADGDGPGDAAARAMAEQGRDWAERVLRREDMRLYVWRLLLEWARVCDDNRRTLGFVGDLHTRDGA